MWREEGNVSWQSLPWHGKKYADCTIVFPKALSLTPDEGPGLVIKITRLNVPCSQGYLYFSSTSTSTHKLCGKLEEIPTLAREIYLPYNKTPSALILRRNPVFSFSYHFVDYCFNVTYTSRNGSFGVKPSSGLHCNYKILLPYGHRVSLTLRIGKIASETSVMTNSLLNNFPHPTERQTAERLSVSTLQPEDPDPPCPGFLIRLWDGPTSWTHCAVSGDPVRELHVISRENRVYIRLTARPLRDHHTSLHLTYQTVPVAEVVQQCEYGWVAVKQFCVTVIDNKRVSWYEAENECNKLQGHLASIRSEQAQNIIDNLLLYR